MDGDEGGIVWMIDGREVPFEAMGESHRPWLEESSAWGDPEDQDPKAKDPDDDGEKDDGSEPPQLLWV